MNVVRIAGGQKRSGRQKTVVHGGTCSTGLVQVWMAADSQSSEHGFLSALHVVRLCM